MSASKLPSPRQNVVQTDPQSGVTMFTRPWFLFFQFIFQQIGGFPPITTNDLAQGVEGGVEELRAMMNTFGQEENLRTEINGLREELAELRKSILDIQQGTTV